MKKPQWAWNGDAPKSFIVDFASMIFKITTKVWQKNYKNNLYFKGNLSKLGCLIWLKVSSFLNLDLFITFTDINFAHNPIGIEIMSKSELYLYIILQIEMYSYETYL